MSGGAFSILGVDVLWVWYAGQQRMMMLVLFCYSRCVCGVEVCRRVCMPGVVESGEVDMGEEMVLGFRLFLSLFFFKKN